MLKFVPVLTLALATVGPVSTANSQDARLSVLHGVPGLSAPVEVLANGASLFTFDYGEQRGPLAVPGGNYAVDVRLSGSSILSANVTLAAGSSYTAIAHLDAAGMPKLSLFTNDTSTLTLPQTRLVVRHTAQAPAVDVRLRQGAATVGTLSGLANSDSQQVAVSPGTYQADLVVSGTSNVAFGPVDLALEDGYVYAVHAVGDVTSSSFRLITQRIALAARVTVVHGIPGLPVPVDVFAGSQQLFSFGFGEIRGPLVLNPGTYPLSVRLQGQTVLSANATVAAGDDVSIVAHLDAQGGNRLSLFANDVTPTDGQTRLTVRHTAAAPIVDVGVTALGQPVTTIANVANGQSRSVVAPAGTYEATLFPAGSTTAAFGPAVLNTVIDTSYIVYAVGDLVGGTFRLLVQTVDLGGAVPGSLVTRVGGVSCGPLVGVSDPTFDYGDHFFVTVRNGQPGAMAMIMLGDSNTAIGAVPLPFDLSAVGAPGCFLSTNLIAARGVVLDASGSVELPFVVPTSTFGSLSPLYFQFAVAASSNSLGVQSSDYLELAPN